MNFVFRRRHNRLFHSKESSLPIGFLNFPIRIAYLDIRGHR